MVTHQNSPAAICNASRSLINHPRVSFVIVFKARVTEELAAELYHVIDTQEQTKKAIENLKYKL